MATVFNGVSYGRVLKHPTSWWDLYDPILAKNTCGVDTNTDTYRVGGDAKLRYSELTPSFVTAPADVTALAGRVTTAEGKVTTLEGKMTTAEGKITTLEADVATLKNPG